MTVTIGMNILITGGAGFIGSRLIRALLAANSEHRIWILDNLHPQVHGQNATPPYFDEHVTFLHGDVGDALALHDAVARSRPALVFHLAAETGTGQSYDEPTRYCLANVMGTTHLIEALRKAGCTERVVLASSRAVYGEGAYIDTAGRRCAGLPRDAATMSAGDFEVPLPDECVGPGRPAPSNPALSPAPASVYASSKLMQEYLLTQAGEGGGWSATILRFQNVYGPGQSLKNPYTGVLSIFAQQLLEGKDLAIFEDGQIARDFVYVDDVVEALMRAGECQLPHGTIIDIGMGEAATIEGAAQTLMQALGRSRDSYAITGAFRVGDIRHACADISAAHELLGWVPQVSINEGLEALAHWAREEFGVTQSEQGH